MNPQILLIDDEVDFCDLTKTMLEFHNFDVDTFCDPIDVLDQVDQKNYDLVVTDLMMPHMDGFHLIEKLRQRNNYKDTPIVVLSAKTLTDEERKYLYQQEVHFLVKPFEPQALVEQIKNLVNESKQV